MRDKSFNENHCWRFTLFILILIATNFQSVYATEPPYLSDVAIQASVNFDNAKKKLSEGSTGAAKNILNAFINEVEAHGCVTYENCPPGKHLTSEAYALLKYNTLSLTK